MIVALAGCGIAGLTDRDPPSIQPAARPEPDSDQVPQRPLPSRTVGSATTPLLTEAGDETAWSDLVITEYSHENEPWAADLMLSLLRSPHRNDDILQSVPMDSSLDYVNIVDGRRVSYQPTDPVIDVWFFGGSTMYGVGQRDHQTIPSVVARLAELDGIAIRPMNFGVSADVNWQATERLTHAVGGGLPNPDLVIFYDGTNDTGLGVQRVKAGDVDFDWVRWLPVSEEQRDAFAANTEVAAIADEDRRAFEIRHAAEQYGRGVELSRSIAAAWEFDIRHFWQPFLTTKVPSPADDPLFRRLNMDPTGLDQRQQVRETLQASGTDAIDVSDVFDDVGVPVYFDSSHTNEFGAWLVAERLYEHLESDIQRLATEKVN